MRTAARTVWVVVWPPMDIASGGYSSLYFDRGTFDERALALAIRNYDFSR